MREEHLFQILGQIDGDLIIAADTPGKRTLPWGNYAKLAGWAASLVLLIGLGTVVFHRIQLHEPLSPEVTPVPNQPTPTDIDGLPILTIEFMVDGMGFEGYMVHSYSDLKNTNPWSESLGITHLPVFRNSIDYAEGYQIPTPDWETMEQQLLAVGDRFGMKDIQSTRREDPYAPSIEGKSGDMTMDIRHDMTTTIRDRETPAKLPSEFHYENYNMPYEKYYSIGEYLQKEYADFIHMENPCINVHGGDYDIYNNQSYHISFYDSCEDPVQRILNYNFNQVHFYTLNGTLDLFRVEHPDLSHVVGNYPIISGATARELLIDHAYMTTVPYDFPGEEYIHGYELVYRSHICEEYFLPYYCFYVELPEENTSENALQNGLLTLGAYYVPAVEGKYIENFPIGELKFN